MELWRDVWRRGFAPTISTDGLEALAEALRADSGQLMQGATTTPPPPLQCVQDWPVEAACAVSFCGWKGDNLLLVGEVEEYFARVCYECDLALNEAACCRYFLNWFDESPREKVRQLLLAEVEFALEGRACPI